MPVKAPTVLIERVRNANSYEFYVTADSKTEGHAEGNALSGV